MHTDLNWLNRMKHTRCHCLEAQELPARPKISLAGGLVRWERQQEGMFSVVKKAGEGEKSLMMSSFGVFWF